MSLVTVNAPGDYRAWLTDLPAGVRFRSGLAGASTVEAAHVFITRRWELRRSLTALRRRLEWSGSEADDSQKRAEQNGSALTALDQGPARPALTTRVVMARLPVTT